MISLLTRRQNKSTTLDSEYRQLLAKSATADGSLPEADAARFETVCRDLGKPDDEVARDLSGVTHAARLAKIAATATKAQAARDKAFTAHAAYVTETKRIEQEHAALMKDRAEQAARLGRAERDAGWQATAAAESANHVRLIKYLRPAPFGMEPHDLQFESTYGLREPSLLEVQRMKQEMGDIIEAIGEDVPQATVGDATANDNWHN